MKPNHLLHWKRSPFFQTPLWIFLRWIPIALAVGVAAGSIGVLFHYTLEWCAETRTENGWLLYLLPVAGILIAWLYRLLGPGDRGTDMVLTAIRANQPMKAITAPLIFAGTALTHLFGGSAGREGAALQLGGSVATCVGRLFRPDEKDSRLIVMCGTSAAFAALFGTPVTAAIFSLEVISVGVMYYSAIVPCVLSAVTGALLARLCGIAPTAFALAGVPEVGALPLLRVLLLGMLCAAVSILFCRSMQVVGQFFKTTLPNVYCRIALGGGILVALTLLVGTRAYNGAGTDIILKAVGGSALPYDFLLKILFTALTLGCGYKGGEIVPVLFTGATFGCVAGGLCGLDPSFAAGVGMVAVFCGVTNCPLASICLSVELFGAQGLPLYAMAIAASYMLSGYSGLYREQKIVYSKLRPEWINIKTK